MKNLSQLRATLDEAIASARLAETRAKNAESVAEMKTANIELFLALRAAEHASKSLAAFIVGLVDVQARVLDTMESGSGLTE